MPTPAGSMCLRVLRGRNGSFDPQTEFMIIASTSHHIPYGVADYGVAELEASTPYYGRGFRSRSLFMRAGSACALAGSGCIVAVSTDDAWP